MKILIALVALLIILPNSFAQSQCDYKVEVILNGSEFQTSDFSWKMKSTKIEGASTNISGTARIADLNGNLIKRYRPWTNESISKQKTSNDYSPNLKEGDYKIISEIYVECDDTNENNNVDAKTIKIKSDGKIKNNENKSTIENKTQHQEIIINNSNSKEQIDDKENDNFIYSNLKNTTKTTEVIPAANAVKNYPIVYQSSNEKSKNMIVFFLLGLSVLLNVILIWKR